MEITPNLSKLIQSINDILAEHDTKASDIPESLIVYAIVNDAPYMIEEFIEDGFVALYNDSPFGWIYAQNHTDIESDPQEIMLDFDIVSWEDGAVVLEKG